MDANITKYVVAAIIVIVAVVVFIVLYRPGRIVKRIANFHTIFQGNMDDVFEIKLTAPLNKDTFELSSSETNSSLGSIKIIATPISDEELKAMTDDIIISPFDSRALSSIIAPPNTAYQSNLKIFNNTDRDIAINSLVLRPFMAMNATSDFTSNNNTTVYDRVILKKGELTRFVFSSKFTKAVSNSANTFLASFSIADSQ